MSSILRILWCVNNDSMIAVQNIEVIFMFKVMWTCSLEMQYCEIINLCFLVAFTTVQYKFETVGIIHFLQMAFF